MATTTHCRYSLINCNPNSGGRHLHRRTAVKWLRDGGTSRSVLTCSQVPTSGGRSHYITSNKKATRRLITIGTSHGKWQGNWSCDYVVSLQDLHLDDLVEDDGFIKDQPMKKSSESIAVFINLSIEKHASFGLSINGKITTSFTRKCSHCSSPYCRQIDANFSVWVLLSAKSDDTEEQLPEIGGDDPSVIYVRPGGEAHLDSLIQDTLRLNASAKDTCSETCARSEPTLQYIGGVETASIDKRWSRLLELRKGRA